MIRTTAILMIALSLAGCKKDTPDSVPLGTIQADIDGVASTFNVEPLATRSISNNNFVIEVKGYKKPRTNSGTYLSLRIEHRAPISTGQYTENSSNYAYISHFVDMFFGVGSSSAPHGSSSSPVQVTITEITSTYIKGSFSGELKYGGGSGETEKITKGIFHVSF